MKAKSDAGFTKDSVRLITLFNFDVDVLAHQMSYYDLHQFQSIPTTEFLQRRYAKSETSPTIVKISEHFNRRTQWIATELYTNDTHGSKILSFFIMLAEVCCPSFPRSQPDPESTSLMEENPAFAHFVIRNY